MAVLAALLDACHGGHSSPPQSVQVPSIPPPSSSGWISGTFLPSSTYTSQCAAPRSGADPVTGQPYPDLPGSSSTENNWLRSWSHELYLWYAEVPDLDPGLYATTDYFPLLKTSATTSSGRPKDRFHFTYPTDQWERLSQSGVAAGYGVEWVIGSAVPPRVATVAYREPNSPAAQAGLDRGARLLSVDGVDFVNDGTQAGVATINAAVYPATAGETHSFEVLDSGAAVPRSFTMTSDNVTSVPVPIVQTIASSSGTVGYLLFNDHLAIAEQALIDAITTLQNAQVDDLVLDIRYNGGGYLAIASELSFMIAGNVPTSGQVFEQTQFSDKYPNTNPVTGGPLTPYPFQSTALGLSAPLGQALPTLDLPRVFVLTGPGTCSASESIINSLRGVNVEVIQIGSTTCGKPYGFYPQDNCGTTYFTVEFRGVNAKGFGDYTDGFSPMNASGPTGVPLPGCSVLDDLDHGLGDLAEARLAAALAYRDTGTCPAASGLAGLGASKPGAMSGVDGRILKAPWRENRILTPWH